MLRTILTWLVLLREYCDSLSALLSGFKRSSAENTRSGFSGIFRTGRDDGEIRQGLLTGLTGSKEITPRVLSRELKELATFGLIERQEFKVMPPKVEYSLSPEGHSLIPVISVMNTWGVEHLVIDAALRKLGIKRS